VLVIRLDKWLWAARFYKTRSQASDAVKTGKVYVNGQRCKPGHGLTPGNVLVIHKGYDQKTVVVHALSVLRGPASVAQQLYEETMESQQCREKENQLRQLSIAQRPRGEGRPTKRARRQIHRFTEPD